ncbi:hypothetical protein Q9L58_005668 [Maublancomyces gigas]|uniref:RING-type domain-containing protein n=1 Tax=Discina gigas TaxID=1032678 RepID=A0ABR3GHI3_9PEZI
MSDCRVWDRESAEIATIIRQLWYYGDILSFTTVEEMLSNPNTNLKQWARDLQVVAGVSSNMVQSDEGVEISRFSDFGEDEDEGVDEEIFYDEDWEAPPSEILSDSEDEDIADGMQCIICHGSHQVTVQFGSCSHVACNTCLRGIYRSRRGADDHFPTWFPCHSCRAETYCVGEISLQPDFCGTEIQSRVYDGQAYTIWNWVPVRRWVAKRSMTVARGLRDKAELVRTRTACGT